MTMSSNTVKCNNCNVVINEVLAFIQNKAAIMDEDSMIRLCVTAFTSDEITLAKKLLFESVDTSRRKVNRRKEGKSQRDMEDIIVLIKESDPELLPVFVARYLHKLPPVTFDHLDATRLLRDIIKLQDDVAIIKEKYVTMDDLTHLKSSCDHHQYRNINMNRKRGGYLLDNSFECESGPVGILANITSEGSMNAASDKRAGVNERHNDTIINVSSVVSPPAHETSSGRSCSVERVEASTAVSSPIPVRATDTGTLEREKERDGVMRPTAEPNVESSTHSESTAGGGSDQRKQLISDVLKQDGEWKKELPSDGWVKVQRKRLQNRFVGLKGRAETSPQCSFKAADVTVPFYIYNVDIETETKDIISYIKSKTNVEVSLKKMDMKRSKGYAAYRFFIPKRKLNVFMDENLWPSGISFRKFVYYSDVPERKQSDLGPSDKHKHR